VTLPYKGAPRLVRPCNEGDTVGMVEMLRGSTARQRHIRRSGLALLAVGLVPLGLSACGSSAANGSSTSTTKPSGKASEAAYTACLKKNGVTLPNFTHGSFPTGGTRPTFTPGSGTRPAGFGAGGFANNPKFAKAAAACKNLRPKGGFGGFGGNGGFNSTAFAAYRNCLKLHGVTLPTGGGRPSPGATPTTPSTTTPSASYQAAIAACAALRPTPSTTTTTG
jgi:hypothetical protein